MKKRVFGAFKEYNANTKNMHKGDCTVRAMSLAYGIEYADVYKELKHIQQLKGRHVYNNQMNVLDFIDKHGGTKLSLDSEVSVREFSSQHSQGTYLVLTRSVKMGPMDHIIAIIDGNIYDTWDSSDQIVAIAYRVIDSTTHLYTDELDAFAAADAIWEPLSDYIESQNDKTDLIHVRCRGISIPDNTTIKIILKCYINDAAYPENFRIEQKFIAKLNIKKTQDENVKSLVPKLRVKIYDWMYNLRKQVEFARKSEEIELPDNFRGDRTFAAKLPDWCHPYLLEATDRGFYSKYEVELRSMDGDPRKSEHPTVFLEGDTFTEIKQRLKYYQTGYQRYGYDY